MSNGAICSLIFISIGFHPISRYMERYGIGFFDFGIGDISIVLYYSIEIVFIIVLSSLYLAALYFLFYRLKKFVVEKYYVHPVIPAIIFSFFVSFSLIESYELFDFRGILLYFVFFAIISIFVLFYYLKNRVYFTIERESIGLFIYHSGCFVSLFFLFGFILFGNFVNYISVRPDLDEYILGIVPNTDLAFWISLAIHSLLPAPILIVLYCLHRFSNLDLRRFIAVVIPMFSIIVYFAYPGGIFWGRKIFFAAKSGYYNASVVMGPESCQLLRSENAFKSDVKCEADLNRADICIIYSNYNNTYIGRYQKKSVERLILTNKSIRIHTSELKSIVLEGPCS